MRPDFMKTVYSFLLGSSGTGKLQYHESSLNKLQILIFAPSGAASAIINFKIIYHSLI